MNNSDKLAQLRLPKIIKQIAETPEFQKKYPSYGRAAYALLYVYYFNLEDVRKAEVTGSKGIKNAKRWKKKGRFPGKSGPDSVITAEETLELKIRIQNEILDHCPPEIEDITLSILFENDRLEAEAKKIDNSWANHFIDRCAEFRKFRGHVLDEQRFNASTIENIQPYFDWLNQFLQRGYLECNIWSLDETNVQIFQNNGKLAVTFKSTKSNFRKGPPRKLNSTLTLCVSGAGIALPATYLVNSKTAFPEFDFFRKEQIRVQYADSGWQNKESLNLLMIESVFEGIQYWQQKIKKGNGRSLLMIDSHGSRQQL
ncbi:MAG: hypothetical protein EZS28_006966 [Streblomastix strix]|uniref:DDE-1 domain-containing protein n=1 Tax=Streblomastix strix TaxID=222440 RepID=A0A5J4WSX0_9EUKA|nr:MAG: hypothetical protein EZS28_006966 [Streblomastix strix]